MSQTGYINMDTNMKWSDHLTTYDFHQHKSIERNESLNFSSQGLNSGPYS